MAFFIPNTVKDQERRAFASKVCEGLWKTGHNMDVTAAYNDGTDAGIMALPGAARYAAERLTCSWRVVFDWSDGKTHTVNVQLPDGCALC